MPTIEFFSLTEQSDIVRHVYDTQEAVDRPQPLLSAEPSSGTRRSHSHDLSTRVRACSQEWRTCSLRSKFVKWPAGTETTQTGRKNQHKENDWGQTDELKKKKWMNGRTDGRTEKLWGCEHVIYYFEYFVWRVEKWIVDNLRAWMCSCVGVRARFLLSHPRSWTLLFSADVREWSGLGWTERRTECEERPAHCSLASCHQLHSLPASAGSGEPGERGARHPRKQRPRTLHLNDPSPPTSDVEARGFCSATEEDKQRHPTSLWTSCKCYDWRYCWGKVSNQWHFGPVS